ncbi:hypothetical protein [Natrarchaeobius versutus]|uniref:hypothetical protein n=1 Tax=Natrarchaeobius versutus TaxID=1679078 RepID=UPI00350F7958
MIPHRLSTVRDVDRILVVDDGQIVEEGSHDELLERDGAYADVWRVQVGDVDALPGEFVSEAAAVMRDDWQIRYGSRRSRWSSSAATTASSSIR